jgi:prevent-host-death family protein
MQVGVRELKTSASEIIRRVRDQRARYVVTYRGKPVGLLLPLDEAPPVWRPGTTEPAEGAWETLMRLGEEIGRGWQVTETGAELLAGMRR